MGKSLREVVIRKHDETGLPTWFGNLTSVWGRSKYHGATDPPYRGDDGAYHPPPEYGDGTPIEKEYLDLVLALAESLQVFIEWQVGDVVLLDVRCSPLTAYLRCRHNDIGQMLTHVQNYAVMHARSPWTGKRTVLAALWDDSRTRISDYPPQN